MDQGRSSVCPANSRGLHFEDLTLNHFTGVLGEVHGGVHFHGAAINAKVASESTVANYAAKSLRPVANYVPRPALHKQLEDRLHATINERVASSKIVVVCGLGGAGKSQLVLHYAQTYCEDYAAVFWIEAGSKDTLERDYVQLWLLLSGKDKEQGKVNTDDAVRGVKAWLQRQEKKWLLIFDSADSIDGGAHNDFIDLSTFIPDAPGVDVIVTTRSQTAKDMTSIQAVQVGDLDEGEASELLLRCSKIECPSDTTKIEVALIVKELGHFALAVALAGAYIAATPRISSRLNLYLLEYRQRRRELLGRKSQTHVHQYGESVLTTWETSYAAIARQRPSGRHLLQIFDPLLDQCSKHAEIWSTAAVAANPHDSITKATLDEAFEILASYSLLSWKKEQNCFAIHKLVHTWGFDRLSSKEQLDYGERALSFMDALLAWRVYDPSARNRLMPHIVACFVRMQEWYAARGQGPKPHAIAYFARKKYRAERQRSEEQLGMLLRLRVSLGMSGKVNQEAMLCQFECTTWQTIRDKQDKNVLSAEHDLAMTYMKQGRWVDAERLNTIILRTRKALLGRRHPDTLASMGNLASTFWNQGRWKEAEELEVKVMETSRTVLGPEHPSTLTSMANLASTYRNQGQWKEAEELEVKVMETSRTVLEPEHPDTLTSMANLMLTYYYQERKQAALELARECLRLRAAVLGATHPDTLSSIKWLKVIEDQMTGTSEEETQAALTSLTINNGREDST